MSGTGAVARATALPLIVLALVGAHSGLDLVQRDLTFTKAQTELGFWGRGTYNPETTAITRAGNNIDALLAANPNHPEYLRLKANYAAWRGYWSKEQAARAAFNQQAQDSQYTGLTARPAHRHSWNIMLEYAGRNPDAEAMRQRAKARLGALQGDQS